MDQEYTIGYAVLEYTEAGNLVQLKLPEGQPTSVTGFLDISYAWEDLAGMNGMYFKYKHEKQPNLQLIVATFTEKLNNTVIQYPQENITLKLNYVEFKKFKKAMRAKIKEIFFDVAESLLAKKEVLQDLEDEMAKCQADLANNPEDGKWYQSVINEKRRYMEDVKKSFNEETELTENYRAAKQIERMLLDIEEYIKADKVIVLYSY